VNKGQAVRVIGEVQDPIDGTNAYSSQTTFPAIKDEFME
jgi:hypothetical protein